MPEQQLPNLKQMDWDIAKPLEMGVHEKFIAVSNFTADQARELVKGILYLKEEFGGDRQ